MINRACITPMYLFYPILENISNTPCIVLRSCRYEFSFHPPMIARGVVGPRAYPRARRTVSSARFWPISKVIRVSSPRGGVAERIRETGTLVETELERTRIRFQSRTSKPCATNIRKKVASIRASRLLLFSTADH